MRRTSGTLLGGRVHYEQPAEGYRTGIEPVLLAAAVPARAGQRVVEAGAGAGAATLCLLHRVPGLQSVAIEIDPTMAELARDNAAANGAAAAVHQAEVGRAPEWGPADHVFANPPWHDPAATAPDASRGLAKQRVAGWEAWVAPLAATVAGRGTLTLVLPAGQAGLVIEALMLARMKRIVLLPLWPRAGVAAKIVLLQARRGAAATRIAPGLVLHEAGGGYTAAAERVLREGDALAMA